jgi:hypothetical protein
MAEYTIYCPDCDEDKTIDITDENRRLTDPGHTVRCPDCYSVLEIPEE